MTHNEVAAFVFARASMLNAKICALQAENRQHPEAEGHMAPNGKSKFDDIISEFDNEIGYNAIHVMIQNAEDN